MRNIQMWLILFIIIICGIEINKANAEIQRSRYLEGFPEERLEEISEKIEHLSNSDVIIESIDSTMGIVDKMLDNTTENSTAEMILKIGETFEEIGRYYSSIEDAQSLPDDLDELSQSLELKISEYPSEEYEGVRRFFKEKSIDVKELSKAVEDIFADMNGIKKNLQSIADIFREASSVQGKLALAFSDGGTPKEIIASLGRFVDKLSHFKSKLQAAINKLMSTTFENNYKEELKGFKNKVKAFHES